MACGGMKHVGKMRGERSRFLTSRKDFNKMCVHDAIARSAARFLQPCAGGFGARCVGIIPAGDLFQAQKRKHDLAHGVIYRIPYRYLCRRASS